MHRKWWALSTISAAIFMLLLDITIVNVALPSIEKSLHAEFSQLQWVIDAYALMLAALLLTSGSLADLFGRRRVFALGLVFFTTASIGCALAQDPLQLILSRALQGVGGAMMFATSLALVASTFHGRDRGIAFGVIGATTGLAVAVGPTVGGALTTGASWEWIFLVNVPVGIAALVMTYLFVDESRGPAGGRVDWIGLTTFSLGLFALVLALIEGAEWGWSSGRVIGLLVASMLMFCGFALAELRQPHPMFDLALLRNRTFLGAAIVAFTISASIFAMFLFLTLYIQNALGHDALQTGLRFLPLSGISFFAAAASGRMTEVVPRRLLLGGGMVLVTLALGVMAVQVDVGDAWTVFLPGFLIAGIGIGLVNPALASTAIGVVDPRRSGMASGVNSTFRQVGIATGIAGLGAIYRSSVHDGVVEGLRDTPAASAASRIGDGVVSGRVHTGIQEGASARLSDVVSSAIDQSVAAGLVDVLWVAAAIALVGAAAAFALVRESDFVVGQGAAAPDAGEPTGRR